MSYRRISLLRCSASWIHHKKSRQPVGELDELSTLTWRGVTIPRLFNRKSLTTHSMHCKKHSIEGSRIRVFIAWNQQNLPWIGIPIYGSIPLEACWGCLRVTKVIIWKNVQLTWNFIKLCGLSAWIANPIHDKFIRRSRIKKRIFVTSSMDPESNLWDNHVYFSDESRTLEKNLADAYGFFRQRAEFG